LRAGDLVEREADYLGISHGSTRASQRLVAGVAKHIT
jgi:hypothetical protein